MNTKYLNIQDKYSRDNLDFNDRELRSNCKDLLDSLKSTNRLVVDSFNKINNYHVSKTKDQTKTVTFCDYLRTTNESISLPRRARSVSSGPSILENNYKFRSILKTSSKNSVCDQYSSNLSVASSDGSKSVGRSLSNIYSELGIEDDYNEKMQHIIKYADLNNDSKFVNPKSLIDYISKKRQKYLSHDYDENFDKQAKEKNRHKKSNLKDFNKKTFKDTSKPLKRSKSVDCIYLNESNNKENNLVSKQKLKKSDGNKTRNYKKIAKDAKKNKPLLGFDWALDNINTKREATVLNKPEEYWQELSQFRVQNKEDCVSSKTNNFNGTINSVLDSDISFYKNKMSETNDEFIEGVNHKCIHSYTLNDRLFPVPVYKDKNGQSVCPVCKSSQKEANSISPQYFKISIPKSKVMDSISIEPKVVSNGSSEDTLSLAESCIAGHQNYTSKIKSKAAKYVDLKSSTKVKDKFPKMTIEELKEIQSNRDPVTSTIYSKANAMRFDLEDMHLKRLRELMPKVN